MTEPTQPPSCSGCPLYGKSRGFAVGCGDPTTAKYAIVLEALGKDEPSFILKSNPSRKFLSTTEECERELTIRKRDYPDLDVKWLRMGVPIVGATGAVLQWWIWNKLGMKREEMFIDNTLRCLPVKGKNGEAYPTGEDRKEAELMCRQYDRLHHFRPDTLVFSLHPAGLLREITPLPLVVKDFEKVRDFTAQGRRVLTLLGGKATHAFARYGGNVTRWRGHFAALSSSWWETYKDDFAYTRKRKREPKVMAEGVCGKKHKGKKVAPKCGYIGCVEDFQRRADADKVQP